MHGFNLAQLKPYPAGERVFYFSPGWQVTWTELRSLNGSAQTR